MNREKKTDELFPVQDKRKKIRKVEKCVLSVLLALVLAATGFVAGWFGRWGALGKKKQSLLWAIDTALENYYREVDEDALYENLFAAFSFDRYSTFYSADEYNAVEEQRNGQNRDAGFSVYNETKPLQIYNVLPDSSAASAGLLSGKYFLKFGKTDDRSKMQSATSAEDYFAFEAKLKAGDTYYVLCGDSENESEGQVYALEHGAQGAGISLTRNYDPMRVYQVVGNSPADHAGLKRGMYILKYGANENADEMTEGSSEEFFAFVNGLKSDDKNNVVFYMLCSFDKTGADAKVYKLSTEKYRASYCYYRDAKEACQFKTVVNADKTETLEKAACEGEELAALGEDTAYIALGEFTGNAAKEFKACLDLMKKNGRKNLILDLRGNGGGYMDVFVEIASYLIKDAGAGNQKVAYAKFRSGATVSYSVKKSFYKEYFEDSSRVSVLADEHTASASECLIGALVDYKTVDFSDIYLRKNAQGTARTYGKGIMQTHYDGPGGATLKLTSADIFWPKSDKSIHNVGVTPADGAIAISSPLLPDANDGFLAAAIELVKSKPTVTPNTPNVSV